MSAALEPDISQEAVEVFKSGSFRHGQEKPVCILPVPMLHPNKVTRSVATFSNIPQEVCTGQNVISGMLYGDLLLAAQ